MEYELYEDNIKSLFRYCTSSGCNIEDGSTYSEGSLDISTTAPPETEPLEEEPLEDEFVDDEVEDDVGEEVNDPPVLEINFGSDKTESNSIIITQSLFLLFTTLLVYI